MTTEEFKEITRAVVVALREELTLDNKDILTKLAEVENKLVYDGRELEVGISVAPGNNLSKRTDGLYARNNYVTTESSPVGEIIAFMGTRAPEHYLFCDGTTYNIGDYPVLEAFFANQFGSVNHFGGDGTSTFAVPDLRGEFLRGSGENHRVSDTGMPQGSGGEVGEHQHATNQVFVNSHSTNTNAYISKANSGPLLNIPDNTPDSMMKTTIGRISIGGNNDGYKDENAVYTARPTNTSVLYCIKYEPTTVDERKVLAARPDLWPENIEIDLGDGLYGVIKTGTVTLEGNKTADIELVRLTCSPEIISCGGHYFVSSESDGSERYSVAIGESSDNGGAEYCSIIWTDKVERTITLSTRTHMERVDSPYLIWVTYRKRES